MKNKKGFVMTETLVVTVFLVSIFSFIYVSIVPLLGKYEDLVDREQDIDVVYRLYFLRKFLLTDENGSSLTSEHFKVLTDVVSGDPTPSDNSIASNFCSKFNRVNYCKNLLQYLELSDFVFIYVDDIYDNLNKLNNYSAEIHDYIKPYQNTLGPVIILRDNSPHINATNTIAHLMLPAGD